MIGSARSQALLPKGVLLIINKNLRVYSNILYQIVVVAIIDNNYNKSYRVGIVAIILASKLLNTKALFQSLIYSL